MCLLMLSNIYNSCVSAVILYHALFVIVMISISSGSATAAAVHLNDAPHKDQFFINTATGRIVDSYGRERVFHGLNVVVKGPPWHPSLELFDPLDSLCRTDVEMLKGLGMNVVRLAVMWPGVEPQEGWINTTYLQVMRSIVGELNSAGIYTLIEFHQDLFSSQFCGEGLPSWVLRGYTQNLQSMSTGLTPTTITDHRQIIEAKVSDDDHSKIAASSELELEYSLEFLKRRSYDQLRWVNYAASFPEPLSGRWFADVNEATDSKLEEKCKSFDWYWYYISYAVSKSFQDLYENAFGWADRMANYWKVVANTFRHEAGVLGYELMNEPWAGDFYHNPLLLLPGVADKINLAPFYEKLQAAIRSEEPNRLLFFESLTFDNIRNGFLSVPGGERYRNRSVLSYHYYRPPNFSPHQTFAERLKEGKKLGCGTMLTEFFVKTAHEGSNHVSSLAAAPEKFVKEQKEISGRMVGSKLDSVEEVLDAADAHVQSWIGWEYKPFVPKTGSDMQDSLFNMNGDVNLEAAKKLARTYPRSVFGKIISFSFDPFTADFILAYQVHTRSTLAHVRKLYSISPQMQQPKISGTTTTSVNITNIPSSEIFFHRAYHYASGIDVSVNESCLHVKELENTISIEHFDACLGKIIEVRIRRNGRGHNQL